MKWNAAKIGFPKISIFILRNISKMTIFAFWRNCRNWIWWWDGGGGHNKAKFLNSLKISTYVLLQIWGSMQIRWALEYVESSAMVSKFGSWAKKISTYLSTHPSLFCWIFSALFSEYAPCDLISKFCNNCTPRLCKDRGKENWWWWWRCWHDDDDDDDHHHDVVDDDSDMGVPRHNPLPPCPSSKSPLCHFVIFWTLVNCCCLHAQFILYWWDMPVSDRQLFHGL